jgi:hemin uptake protein HemP
MLHTTTSASHAGHEPVSAPAMAAAPTRASALLRIDSERLLAGGRELVIAHAGQEYRLRLTRNDKLILTK